jgi:hypothetical protein
MCRYSAAFKVDVRRRLSPPMLLSVAPISVELGIHARTLYNWRKTWRLQGEAVPASEKDPEGCTIELSAYCQERGLYWEQIERWRRAAEDANATPGSRYTRSPAYLVSIRLKAAQPDCRRTPASLPSRRAEGTAAQGEAHGQVNRSCRARHLRNQDRLQATGTQGPIVSAGTSIATWRHASLIQSERQFLARGSSDRVDGRRSFLLPALNRNCSCRSRSQQLPLAAGFSGGVGDP